MDMNLMHSQLSQQKEKYNSGLSESKDSWLDTAAHAIVANFEQDSWDRDMQVGDKAFLS